MPTTPSPIIVYAQACDLCRKMKIKCERAGDECAHCIASNAECTFAPVERRPPKIKRPELLDSMEQRIERMEAILSATDLGGKSRASSPDEADDDYELANQGSSLTLGPDGETTFTGPSSAISLLSPAGKKWVAQHTGSTELDSLVPESLFTLQSDPQISSEWFQQLGDEDREALPKKSLAVKYANAYFRHFNNTYPIIDREAFVSQLDRMYASRTLDDISWYSLLNAVLAFGSLLYHEVGDGDLERAQDAGTEDINRTWGYFRNASSNLVELMLRPNLLSVQALLIIASMLQRTSQIEALSVILSAAAQMSHRMGLHILAPTSKIPKNELEQRCHIFWVLFILEQALSLRTGRPSIMQEDDIGIRLPMTTASGSSYSSQSGSPQSPSSPNEVEDVACDIIFRYHCELAIQQNRLLRELYSPRSRLRSQLERLTSITQIDSALQSWQHSMPSSVRPGCDLDGTALSAAHILKLHLAFYDTLNSLHRVCPFNQAWFTGATQPSTPQTSPVEGKGRVYASASISTSAARSSLSLISTINNTSSSQKMSNFGISIWDGQHQYYLASSILTIFAHTVSNSEDSKIVNDLELLASLSTVANQITASPMQSLHNIATQHVSKIKSRSVPRSKRSRDNSKAKPQPAKIHPKNAVLRRSSVSTASRRQSQSHSPGQYASTFVQTPSSGQSPAHFSHSREVSYHHQQQQHVQGMILAQQMRGIPSSSEPSMIPVEATSIAPAQMPESYPHDTMASNPYDSSVAVYGDTAAQMNMPNEWQLADPQHSHPSYPQADQMEDYSPTNTQQVMDIHHPQPQHFNQGHIDSWQENNALGIWYEGSTSPEAFADDGACGRQASVDLGLGTPMNWAVQGQCHQLAAAAATGLGGMERDMHGLQGAAEGMVIM